MGVFPDFGAVGGRDLILQVLGALLTVVLIFAVLMLLVSAIDYSNIGELVRRLDALVAERVLLRRCAEAGVRLASSCNASLLLVTDGLDRDDAGELSLAAAELARWAREIIWLNPLLRYDGFEPKAAGIRALTIHGRTRCQQYTGEAEYDTIRAVKAAATIPIIANGDITSPEKAKQVLDYTGADGVMVGRAAQGRPWIFREIRHFLETGTKLPPPDREEVRTLMNEHVTNLHQFYGAYLGARIARKHVGWYLDEEETGREFRKHFNALDCADAQLNALEMYFDGLG